MPKTIEVDRPQPPITQTRANLGSPEHDSLAVRLTGENAALEAANQYDPNTVISRAAAVARRNRGRTRMRRAEAALFTLLAAGMLLGPKDPQPVNYPNPVAPTGQPPLPSSGHR